MFSAFRSARRKSSHLALAIALAGGAAFAMPAVAQEYSPGFSERYNAVSPLVQEATLDIAGAAAQIDSVIASVQTADDRMAAGNLVLIVGNRTDDAALQRRGLEMMVASGKVEPERLGLFQYNIGSLAYNAGDYQAARDALLAAQAAGYVNDSGRVVNDPEYIVMQSYFTEDNFDAGFDYVSDLYDARAAAGNPLDERYLLFALQNAYDNDLAPQAATVSRLVLEGNPSTTNWTNALRIYYQISQLDPQMEVDTLRLMREVGANMERQELSALIDSLDARNMGTEVLSVLDTGVAAGIYEESEVYYTDNRDIARRRSAIDRNEVATIIADGNTGDVRDTIASANVLYGLGNYSDAATLFERAAGQSADPSLALTRLGMAQLKMGEVAAAQETFARVTGPRATLAQFWSIYADTLSAQ